MTNQFNVRHEKTIHNPNSEPYRRGHLGLSFLSLFLEFKMKTITLDRARYTLRDDRDIMGDLIKITGKHKPVKSKGPERRLYPAGGASLSTAAYVAQYYGLNSTRRLFKNHAAPYGDANLVGFYEGLSNRLSVPEGEDSMEVEL